jgi:hypothetical protein
MNVTRTTSKKWACRVSVVIAAILFGASIAIGDPTAVVFCGVTLTLIICGWLVKV